MELDSLHNLGAKMYSGDVSDMISCHDLTYNSLCGCGGSSSGSTSNYGSRGPEFDSLWELGIFFSSYH